MAGKNIKLSEYGNVVQVYDVVVTTAAAATASQALVFDAAFTVAPDILSVFVVDTDGTKAPLLDVCICSDITVSGLTVRLHGLGGANIGVGTMTVRVMLHGQNN